MIQLDTLWALNKMELYNIAVAMSELYGSDNSEVCKRIYQDSQNANQVQHYIVDTSPNKEGDQATAILQDKGMTTVKASGGKVAVIPIVGAMQKQFSHYYESTSTVNVIQNIQAANVDPDINSIVLYINSGGGTVAGTYELGQAIKKSRKPVLGAIGDSCCSAALWAGSQTSYLYATTPTAGIGSIGVITSHADVSELLQRIGIKMQFITSTGDDAKAFGNPFEVLSDDAKAYIKSRLDSTKEIFKSTILKGRGDRILNPNEAITAKVVSPKTAKNLGLIDGMATLEQVIIQANRQGKKLQRDQKRSNINKLQSTKRASAQPLNTNNMSLSLLDKYVTDVHTEAKTYSPAQLNQLEARLSSFEDQIKSLETDLEEAKASNKGLAEKLATAEANANTSQEKVNTLTSKVEALENEKTELASKLNTANTNAQEATDKVTNLEEQITSKDSKIADLENQLEVAKAAAPKTDDPKGEEKSKEQKAQEAKIAQMEAALEEAKANYNTLAEKLGGEEKKKGEDTEGKKSERQEFSYSDLRRMKIPERLAYEKSSRGRGKILSVQSIRR